MIKYLLTLLLILFGTSTVFAQSFFLSIGSSDSLKPDTTIEVWGETGEYVMLETSAVVNNPQSFPINVKVKKTHISIVEGTTNNFCWGACFGPTTFVSPSAMTIDAGGNSGMLFSGHYNTNGTVGSSIIKYTFFLEDDPTDSVAFNVKYTASSTSINESKQYTYTAYPNPASSIIDIQYSFQGANDAKLVITNLLGSEVYNNNINVESKSVKINVSDFNSGVYFYSFIVDGKRHSTKKLIVRH